MSEMSESGFEPIDLFATLDDLIGHEGVDVNRPLADDEVADAEVIE